MSNSSLPTRSSTGDRPLGLSQLAQKLRRRSFDLIAVGAIASLCLAFGQTLTQWWSSTDDGSANGAGIAGEAVPDSALDLWSMEFGDLPLRVTRQETAGDVNAAWTQLTEYCRARLRVEATGDAGVSSNANLPNFDRVLRRLSGLEPFARIADAGELYRLSGALPTVVAIRTTDDAREISDGALGRLICWGVAMPGQGSQWRLYLFEPSDAPATSAPFDLPALFDETSTILSVTDPDGTRLQAFSIPADLGQWAGRVRRNLVDAGWRVVDQRRDSLRWSVQLVHTEADRTRTCLLHAHTNAAGVVHGIVSFPGHAAGLSTRGAP